MLKKILDSMSISSDGIIQWNGTSPIYDRYLSLLLDPQLNKDIQLRLKRMRYYFASEGNIFYAPELYPIWAEMKQESKPTFADFMQKLDALLNKIKRENKCVEFNIYYPLNIKSEGNINAIKFRDGLIEVKTYEEIKSLLDDKMVQEDFKFPRFKTFIPSNYRYIKITLRARNGNYAEQVATDIRTLDNCFYCIS